MTFISYAQNFEDVMLWRALGHVEKGFYIDAGAWSPDDDSVTRAFYERGWRGINIEPNPTWFGKLCEKRPEDINLQLALSDKEETLNLYVVVDVTGLSTIEAKYAEKNKEAGQPIQELPCQATTLNKLWGEHVHQTQVHFLKIDVEGAEEAVIRGNDWISNRPWIVLIESTYPNTQISTHHLWEHFLLEANYIHVYADGLNRYYVAKEHSDLAVAFSYPPNIFDQFILSSHAQAEADVLLLSQQHRELFQQHHELSQQYRELSQQYHALEVQHLAAVQILSELRKTRIYRVIQKLRQWLWLEERILGLAYFQDNNDSIQFEHNKGT